MSCPGNISENPVKIGWLDILLPNIGLPQEDRTFRHDHLRSPKGTQPIEKAAVYVLMEPCCQINRMNNWPCLS